MASQQDIGEMTALIQRTWQTTILLEQMRQTICKQGLDIAALHTDLAKQLCRLIQCHQDRTALHGQMQELVQSQDSLNLPLV